MSVEEEDDDVQSFYSVFPEAPAETWPEAAVYHAQSNILPLLAAPTTTPPSHTGPDAHSSTSPTAELTSKSAIPPSLSQRLPQPSLLPTQRHLADSDARDESHTRLRRQRPSTSGGERISTRSDAVRASDAALDVRKTRSKTVSAPTAQAHAHIFDRGDTAVAMNYTGNGRDGDLFLELANDQAGMEEDMRPTSHGEPLQSRGASFNKRRSLPPENGLASYSDSRPRSSGQLFGRVQSSDIQRHVNRYSSSKPGRLALQVDDTASVSSASRSGVLYRPTPSVMEPSPLQSKQMRSPELPQYGRGRPSFGVPSRPINDSRAVHLSGQLQGAYSRSAAGTSEQKHSLADSASVDSQTADTVWDELDDLKSRIKKLELTGKLPPTSGAALSTEQGDRPRTATTAPTTIDSSPNHNKPGNQEKTDNPEMEPISPEVSQEVSGECIVGGPDAANIHPNLHLALAKAKTLLNPSLYRSLQATAADALQLAVMTGSAGPQGTALTAAAIINGVTVSDRHVRRKADTMCRNLTDLVLALCEGRIDTPHLVSSPITINTPVTIRSPTLRHSRSSLDPQDSLVRNRSRPMSRLEATRSSVFGSQTGGSLGQSALESGEDMSASEQESTASRLRPSRDSLGQGRAVSRLQAARIRMYGDGAGEDDDPTVRPPSRAATDFTRTKTLSGKDYSTPRRSPSFREHLAARRASQEGIIGSHREQLSRSTSLASDSGRSRRFLDPNTPPLLEQEEGGRDDASSYASQPSTRRVPSSGPYARRSATEMPSRTPSLLQRRQVLVE